MIDCISVSFSIEDNHANNVNKIFKPYIFGGTLANNYEFESFHFHWGLKNYRGSEHIINDVSYPLELHIIHRNVQYNNLTAAVNEKDGLVVLGIMFEVSLCIRLQSVFLLNINTYLLNK